MRGRGGASPPHLSPVGCGVGRILAGGAVVRGGAGVAPDGVPRTAYNRRGREASISRPLKYKRGESAPALDLQGETEAVTVRRWLMGEVRVINRGVDTLILNAYYTNEDGKPIKRELDDALALQLEEWKKAAQGTGDLSPTSLLFNGASLHMCPNGAGHGQWPWMLKTNEITLYVSQGQWNGIASVRFNAEYLWSCQELLDAIVRVQELLDDLFHQEMFLQVSAVDLCADIAGWQEITSLDRRRNFVSRSRKRSVHREPEWGYDASLQEHTYGLQETGFDFSKRGPLSCTIYDKTRELHRSGKSWFLDLWQGRGWDEVRDGAVWRVEFKFKREALHELMQEEVFHGVEDVYDLPELLPVLWAYAAGRSGGGSDGLPDGWLRCVVPKGDKNRSRWPTHPAWKVVQEAFTEPMEQPEDFGKIVRKRREEHSIEKGIEAVTGYLTSLAAWAGGELADPECDVSVVLHWLAMKVNDYLERVERDFAAEVRRKRVRLGLQVATVKGPGREVQA
jgi:hypothetical protein